MAAGNGRHSGLTACFAARVAAWFDHEGPERVADRAFLRQMNMAIALAVSRWHEFAENADALPRMRAWLEEVERRATARNAQARAEAIRQVRNWLEDCARSA